MTASVPAQARVVIVGGGIVGCSVAYHLARLGWTDVVLLEQGGLSGGTTWHAAGLVGQLRSSRNLTQLIRESARLYSALEAETGQATGWTRCGSLSVARTAERMIQLRRNASLARAYGIEAEVIGLEEARALYPLMRTDDLVGAVWIPGDGKANPADITQALARGARQGGVRVREGVRVTSVRLERGRVAGVETSAGPIATEVVVNAAGMWARELGRMSGVTVPLHACEHMYIVTHPIPAVMPDLPVMRDADGHIYFKEEVGGLLMGGFDPWAKPWGMGGIPADFSFATLPPDWGKFEVLMTNALQRVPALETAPVRTLLNGPESFTPDNYFILGEAPEVRRYYVAAGFCSGGIAAAGGAGKALAEWIVGDEPPMDLWQADIRRFMPFHGNVRFLRERASEIVGVHYDVAFPNRELETGRGLRRSPVHERLAARGACFGAKMGWERPNWFAPAGVAPETVYSFGRQNWFPHVAAEHRATREAVAIFDQTSFSKFVLEGPGAEAVLQRLCANDVAVPPGTLVYTALLNERGGFESDLTVTRLAADAYFIVTGSAQTTRDSHWIRRHIPPGSRAVLSDVTGAFAVLGVMGPRSRELLSRVTDADLSHDAFPFATMQEIGMGPAPVRASRITYVGELGWELYVPAEFAAGVYDTLREAGGDLGLRDAGYYAIDSLRMEKAYRAWGRELTPEDTPLEAGLGFAVRLDKGAPFLGREALRRQKQQALSKRLVTFVLEDPEALPLGDEPIVCDGRVVGSVTSAAFGHTLGRAVALGYVRRPEGVDAAFVESAGFELEIAGHRFRCRGSLEAPYDPRSLRVKA
ncbi:MAG: FAD-dependent oxidoreductase [Candidatus Rokubacteria bacterium RIFCSPLOWO2_12_FULL_71_19]|nr:MAG: FAD-dependent oxidoreductase [Candidatus Rokubacteria bacterium RIFCSPLOWO2_12_FULL_71_19]